MFSAEVQREGKTARRRILSYNYAIIIKCKLDVNLSQSIKCHTANINARSAIIETRNVYNTTSWSFNKLQPVWLKITRRASGRWHRDRFGKRALIKRFTLSVNDPRR